MIQSKAERNCPTKSEPKHREKSSDLRCCLKTVGYIDEMTLEGKQQPEMSDRQWWSGASAVQVSM